MKTTTTRAPQGQLNPETNTYRTPNGDWDICNECGALVDWPDRHHEWHLSLEPQTCSEFYKEGVADGLDRALNAITRLTSGEVNKRGSDA